MSEVQDAELPEVEVSAPAVGTQKKKMRSPWKAALMGLAGGPLVSLAFGLGQHFRNKELMDKEATRSRIDRTEREELKGLLANEYALGDDDEKRMLKAAQSRMAYGYELVAAGDTKQGYEMIEKSRTIMEGIIGGDIQARKQEQGKQWDAQRELVGTAAKAYRQEFQSATDALNGIDHQATKILDLVAQPDFDPNKPVNKAHLAELLSMGGLMFKDTPDMMDGLTQGVGAINGIAGGVIGGLATMLKSQDFKISAEDYNRLALNAQKYGRIFAERKLGQLGDQARSLDGWGKKVGVIPEDYSLGQYISGGEKELRTNPNPHFSGGYKPSPEQEAQERMIREAATQQLINQRFGGRGASGSWGPAKRPTN